MILHGKVANRELQVRRERWAREGCGIVLGVACKIRKLPKGWYFHASAYACYEVYFRRRKLHPGITSASYAELFLKPDTRIFLLEITIVYQQRMYGILILVYTRVNFTNAIQVSARLIITAATFNRFAKSTCQITGICFNIRVRDTGDGMYSTIVTDSFWIYDIDNENSSLQSTTILIFGNTITFYISFVVNIFLLRAFENFIYSRKQEKYGFAVIISFRRP